MAELDPSCAQKDKSLRKHSDFIVSSQAGPDRDRAYWAVGVLGKDARPLRPILDPQEHRYFQSFSGEEAGSNLTIPPSE